MCVVRGAQQGKLSDVMSSAGSIGPDMGVGLGGSERRIGVDDGQIRELTGIVRQMRCRTNTVTWLGLFPLG